jgi:hypothetical protein
MSGTAQAATTTTAADWVSAISSAFAGVGTLAALVLSAFALLRERRRDRCPATHSQYGHAAEILTGA